MRIFLWPWRLSEPFCLQDYREAVAVMLFYQVGELFQSYAVGRSRRSIASLMDIRPDYAHVEENGELVKRDPEEIAVGQSIVVLPGERIPLDGQVVEGHSSLDTSALTGESAPRDVEEGEDVISGCVNLTGRLHIRVSRVYGGIHGGPDPGYGGKFHRPKGQGGELHYPLCADIYAWRW